MLLRIRRHLDRSDDRGAALVGVIAVMAVGLIVCALVLSSVVAGFSFSRTTRASIQSQAAADAGVAAARVGLFTFGNCVLQPTPGVYASSGTPNYSAVIQVLSGGAWVNGCPAVANMTPQVRILSTGTAPGPSGNGTTAKVEAIYNYLWPGVTPSGVAVYLYAGGIVQANSSMDMSESPGAGLVVKKGNLVCGKNNTVINGDIVVDGNLDLGSNSCAINGNAWVSGAVTLGSKGNVSENLSSSSVTPNPPGKQVGGTYTQSGVLPSTPNWVDIPYTPSDWVDSLGTPYEVKTLSGSSCTQYGGSTGGTIPGNPIIINALACTNGIQVTNNTTFKLTSDVVFFAPMFSWGSINQLNFASADGAGHHVWFVTPDNTADGKPTCASGEGDFAVNNSFQIQAPIDAMLYTPCSFSGKNGYTWRGQLYAGGYSDLENNPTYSFTSVGIAGYDLTAGQKSTTILTPQIGTVISNRNVAG
ncbi:hypothetical protein [Galbitalea soli]|uniref:Uncharacterized protein n=1 Tax=Galbitalea soli TaxID=1268042 RepID=A0A7C9TPM3_9MICO|nr:hypothetical protein [Galbitalea soli]NEM90857.1 hypothetical protein [Galbitalea soli]NYJ31577.1 hypothetical protein [Galbitalea soli]